MTSALINIKKPSFKPELHQQIEALYLEHRYLEAFELCAPYWDRRELLAELSIEDLILLARLASRIGAITRSSWLLRYVWRKAPQHPEVKYYARSARHKMNLLDEFNEYAAEPTLQTDNADLAASWCASHANLWALVRNFDEAHRLIEQGRSISPDKQWLDYCEADILMKEDRWQEALDLLDDYKKECLTPPYLVLILVRLKLKLNRFEEVLDDLAFFAAGTQSFQVIITHCWYLCAKAERCSGADQQLWARKAAGEIARLDEFLPVGNGNVKHAMNCCKLDIAMLLGERQDFAELASQTRSPYYKEIYTNFVANPHGRRYLAPYKALFQKHDTCMPTSIASILGAFGDDIDEDELAKEISYGGTPGWRAFEWLQKRGYSLRHFLPDKDLVKKVIQLKLPFLMLTSSDTSGHAMAVVGFDEATDTIIIHDPSSERWQQVLADKVGLYESPVGPHCTAIIPEERAAELDFLPTSENDLLTAYERFFQVTNTQGSAKAAEIVERAGNDYPDHDISRYLKAIHLSNSGQGTDAIEILKEMVARHQESAPVRRALLQSCRKLANSGLILEVLSDVVKKKKLPGINAQQSWSEAPVTYICQYVDLLSQSSKDDDEVMKLLKDCLLKAPVYSEPYHILGDFLSNSQREKESLLPYKIASYLELENDHYARAASDTLCRLKGPDEALTFMRQRRDRLEVMDFGAPASIGYIDLLEDLGFPGEAMEEAERALSRYSSDEQLHAYACRLWIRMGCWDKAKSSIDKLESGSNRLLYFESATFFCEMSGQWAEASSLAEQWFQEAPSNTLARRYHLHLSGIAQGPHQRLTLTEEWQKNDPKNETLQELYLCELDENNEDEKKIQLLEERLKDNGRDAWG